MDPVQTVKLRIVCFLADWRLRIAGKATLCLELPVVSERRGVLMKHLVAASKLHG